MHIAISACEAAVVITECLEFPVCISRRVRCNDSECPTTTFKEHDMLIFCVKVKVAQSCPTVTPWTIESMEFSRSEY